LVVSGVAAELAVFVFGFVAVAVWTVVVALFTFVDDAVVVGGVWLQVGPMESSEHVALNSSFTLKWNFTP
jgi:hypothetical protein